MTAATALHDESGRVRAPWRIAFFGVALAVAWVGLQVVVEPIVLWVGRAFGVRLVVYQWVVLGALILAHVATFGLVECRTWGFAGLHLGGLKPRPMLLGTALGALAIGIPSLLLLGVGWLEATPWEPGGSLMVALRLLLILAPAAMVEELLFRGYAFAAVREVWGSPAALAISSITFGLVHLQNPGASAQSVALVTFAGVFLGMVRLVTCSLWATWAAHLAWNWVLAALLHSAVSGVPLPTPDYRVVDAGPDWATGGDWGPEGGAFAALGMLLAMGALHVHTRRNRRRES